MCREYDFSRKERGSLRPEERGGNNLSASNVTQVCRQCSYCAFPKSCEKLAEQKVANSFFFSELCFISACQATELEPTVYLILQSEILSTVPLDAIAQSSSE